MREPCVCVYACVCVCVCVCVCACMYVLCTYVHTYVCVYGWMDGWMNGCLYVWMFSLAFTCFNDYHGFDVLVHSCTFNTFFHYRSIRI